MKFWQKDEREYGARAKVFNLKAFVSMLLALALIFGAISPAVFANETPEEITIVGSGENAETGAPEDGEGFEVEASPSSEETAGEDPASEEASSENVTEDPALEEEPSENAAAESKPEEEPSENAEAVPAVISYTVRFQVTDSNSAVLWSEDQVVEEGANAVLPDNGSFAAVIPAGQVFENWDSENYNAVSAAHADASGVIVITAVIKQAAVVFRANGSDANGVLPEVVVDMGHINAQLMLDGYVIGTPEESDAFIAEGRSRARAAIVAGVSAEDEAGRTLTVTLIDEGGLDDEVMPENFEVEFGAKYAEADADYAATVTRQVKVLYSAPMPARIGITSIAVPAGGTLLLKNIDQYYLYAAGDYTGSTADMALEYGTYTPGNFAVSGGSYNIVRDGGTEGAELSGIQGNDVNISGTGNLSVVHGSAAYAIDLAGTLTISGINPFYAKAQTTAISGGNLVVEGSANVTAYGGDYGVDIAGDITVRGGARLSAPGRAKLTAIQARGHLLVNGATVRATGGDALTGTARSGGYGLRVNTMTVENESAVVAEGGFAAIRLMDNTSGTPFSVMTASMVTLTGRYGLFTTKSGLDGVTVAGNTAVDLILSGGSTLDVYVSDPVNGIGLAVRQLLMTDSSMKILNAGASHSNAKGFYERLDRVSIDNSQLTVGQSGAGFGLPMRVGYSAATSASAVEIINKSTVKLYANTEISTTVALTLTNKTLTVNDSFFSADGALYGISAGSGNITAINGATIQTTAWGNDARPSYSNSGIYSGGILTVDNATVIGEAKNDPQGTGIDIVGLIASGNAKVRGQCGVTNALGGTGIDISTGEVTLSGNAEVWGDGMDYGVVISINSSSTPVTIKDDAVLSGTSRTHGIGISRDVFVEGDALVEGTIGLSTPAVATETSNGIEVAGNLTVSGNARVEAYNNSTSERSGAGLHVRNNVYGIPGTLTVKDSAGVVGNGLRHGLLAESDITVEGEATVTGTGRSAELLYHGTGITSQGTIRVSGSAVVTGTNSGSGARGIYTRHMEAQGDAQVTGKATGSSSTANVTGAGIEVREDLSVLGNAVVTGTSSMNYSYGIKTGTLGAAGAAQVTGSATGITASNSATGAGIYVAEALTAVDSATVAGTSPMSYSYGIKTGSLDAQGTAQVTGTTTGYAFYGIGVVNGNATASGTAKVNGSSDYYIGIFESGNGSITATDAAEVTGIGKGATGYGILSTGTGSLSAAGSAKITGSGDSMGISWSGGTLVATADSQVTGGNATGANGFGIYVKEINAAGNAAVTGTATTTADNAIYGIYATTAITAQNGAKISGDAQGGANSIGLASSSTAIVTLSGEGTVAKGISDTNTGVNVGFVSAANNAALVGNAPFMGVVVGSVDAKSGADITGTSTKALGVGVYAAQADGIKATGAGTTVVGTASGETAVGILTNNDGSVAAADGAVITATATATGSDALRVQGSGIVTATGEGTKIVATADHTAIRSAYIEADGTADILADTYWYGVDEKGAYGAVVTADNSVALADTATLREVYHWNGLVIGSTPVDLATTNPAADNPNPNLQNTANYTWTAPGHTLTATAAGVEAISNSEGAIVQLLATQNGAGGENTSYAPGAKHTISMPATLNGDPIYTLTFDLNDPPNGPPSGVLPTPAAQQLKEGALAEQPANPADYVGYGYTGIESRFQFLSWNTAPDGSGTTWNFSSSTMPKGNMTLYAQWNIAPLPLHYYTINYEPGEHGTFERQSSLHLGGDLTPAAPTITGEAGWAFTGWSPTPTETVFGNTTYVAQWAPAAVPEPDTFTVTFVNWDGSVLKTEIVEAGNDATAPPDPFRTGFIFIGWDIAFTDVQSDLTVTAQYDAEIVEPIEPPLGGGSAWALVNLILAGLGALMAVITGVRALKKRDEDEEDGRERKPLWIAAALLAGIAGVVIFLLTQDMSQAMGLVDNWTVAHGVLGLGGLLGTIFGIKRNDQ